MATSVSGPGLITNARCRLADAFATVMTVLVRSGVTLAVSVHAATDTASGPLQWRLFLPQEWESDTDRRTITRIPPDVTHREKWRLLLRAAPWRPAGLRAIRSNDPASKARLEERRRELADLRGEADAEHAQWEGERQTIRRVQDLRQELEQVRHEAEEAERAYDLNRAAELRYGRLQDLERRLAAEEDQLAAKQGQNRLLREVVTEEEIADIVAAWTGIPVARLQEGEREKSAASGALRQSSRAYSSGPER